MSSVTISAQDAWMKAQELENNLLMAKKNPPFT